MRGGPGCVLRGVESERISVLARRRAGNTVWGFAWLAIVWAVAVQALAS
jgi:hypothetical protein